jgi:hypothetical protein
MISDDYEFPLCTFVHDNLVTNLKTNKKMKKIIVLASVLIFTASVTVFGQTQKPADSKKTTTTTTTTTTTSTAKPATTTTTVKQEPAKPGTTTTAQQGNKTKAEIAATDLPKAAQEYIAKAYPGKKIDKAIKVTDDKGVVTYKAVVGQMMLHFDASGKFTKEMKMDEKPATETKTTTTTPPKPAPTTEKKK